MARSQLYLGIAESNEEGRAVIYVRKRYGRPDEDESMNGCLIFVRVDSDRDIEQRRNSAMNTYRCHTWSDAAGELIVTDDSLVPRRCHKDRERDTQVERYDIYMICEDVND